MRSEIALAIGAGLCLVVGLLVGMLLRTDPGDREAAPTSSSSAELEALVAAVGQLQDQLGDLSLRTDFSTGPSDDEPPIPQRTASVEAPPDALGTPVPVTLDQRLDGLDRKIRDLRQMLLTPGEAGREKPEIDWERLYAALAEGNSSIEGMSETRVVMTFGKPSLLNHSLKKYIGGGRELYYWRTGSPGAGGVVVLLIGNSGVNIREQ